MAQEAKPIIIYMSKKTTITVDEKEFILNFNVNCFRRYFKEATGIDLYEVAFEVALKMQTYKKVESNGQPSVIDVDDNIGLLKGTKMYDLIATSQRQDYASGLLYAGYAAEQTVNAKPIEHNYEFFKNIVDLKDDSFVEYIINEYNGVKMQTTGEA